ncbi:MAG: glycoside hydrolase family 32 protein [Anaerolineae bacterium]|nr:glycoside hydrolase family 32 protein [Phycisphaerae bacterium]
MSPSLLLLALALVSDPLYAEPLRPQFHFTAAKNWINDPNGLVFYDGVYHLFFQYNPHGLESANKSWGHATSTDLVHWAERDIALLPDESGEVWSGSAVVDESNTTGFQQGDHKPIVLIYTAAGKRFTQRIAYSVDGAKTFTKHSDPVLEHIRGGNRDPKVIWHAPMKRWIMTLYLDGADFALFASPDLKSWTQLQTFTVPGTDECPDFFEMPIEAESGKTAWVWMAANGQYLAGEFDGKKFSPEHGFRLPIASDYCRDFYAGQTFSNMPDGRRVQIAWLRDGKYPGMPFNQQLSFPTTLTLHRAPDGLRLRRVPVKEIESLHDVAAKSLSDLSSDLLDFTVVIEPGNAKRVGLRVRGETVAYDVAEKTLSTGSSRALLAPIGGRITLRILLDCTSIEVFANDGVVSLSRCFLPDLNSKIEPPSFFAEGGDAQLISCDGYTLKSAWKK